MTHFRTHKGHAACDKYSHNVALTNDPEKVRCPKCKRTDQYKMAKSDNSFSLDDGRKWNNLIFN